MTSGEYTIKFFSNDNKEICNHKAFLEEFAKEFESKTSQTVNYYEFNSIISEMYMVFKAILIDKNRRSYISKKLWKAFFAIYVVPKRRNLFPAEQERIDQRRNRKFIQNQ